MKNKSLYLILILSLVIIASAFTLTPSPTSPAADEIEWLTWEEMQEKMKKEPKKVMIDVYTDWCGWCKRMDATTFKDPKVAEAMNKNFYAVKLDAEQREEIIFDNHSFKFVEAGTKGHHELAAALLNNSMSYPSFVILDEKMQRIMIIKGFQQTPDMLCALAFTSSNQHAAVTYEDFKSTWKQ